MAPPSDERCLLPPTKKLLLFATRYTEASPLPYKPHCLLRRSEHLIDWLLVASQARYDIFFLPSHSPRHLLRNAQPPLSTAPGYKLSYPDADTPYSSLILLPTLARSISSNLRSHGKLAPTALWRGVCTC